MTENKSPKPKNQAQDKNPSSSPEAAEITSPLANVVVRNQFYRDGYRTLVKIALIEAMAIVALLITFVIFINVYNPQDRYFATTEDGRVVPMVPLSQANLSRPALTSWAAQAVTETMTFGFHDYRRRLQESSRHFTPQGWRTFTKALMDSGTIETVRDNRQIINATLRAAPTILAEGLMPNGVYRWELEMPMALTYELGQSKKTKNSIVRLVIVRIPKLESAVGVGIESWQEVSG